MKYLFVLFLSFLIIINNNNLIAQNDSTKTEDWDFDFEDWEWDFDFNQSNKRPTISLSYGISNISKDNLKLIDFDKIGLFELKLGYQYSKKINSNDYLSKYGYGFFYLKNESSKHINAENESYNVKSEMWSFGFGKLIGYGYDICDVVSIIPYNSNTINWTKVNFDFLNNLESENSKDVQTLKLYDDSFRFGSSGEGGIRIGLFNYLLFDFGYERSIIFQRHLFWKWVGSSFIEMGAGSILDKFIDEVFESSAGAGPIVFFLLKNGLTYGIYELRKEKMNWPFKTASPLFLEQFKFGVTFVF
ncbi:MAG: hypothetical protein KDC88_14035 [Ignavibacteriae bacterium]|nr:hypothetical protein [Ignavibacteriota bacterium]